VTGSDGVDVASYQSSDYSTAGLTFVFVKATEGGGYVNPRHGAQIAHGRARGLVVGHYHFARPGSVTDQVKFFLRTAAPQPGDVLCLDWEDTGVSSDWKDAWLRAVQAAMPTHEVVLYCNRDFWINRDHSSFAGDGLWIADPNAPKGAPGIKADWLIHQWSEAGGVDHDYSPLSPAQFHDWAAKKTPEEDMAVSDADAQKIARFVASYSHGDDPDVHQTWQTAAEEAAAAASGVQTLLKGTPVTLSDAQLDQLAAKVAPLLPKPASAAQIADELAKRLQS
jgi:hypothetical protein